MARTAANESSFATAVLQGIGAPVTQSNLDFIEKWITREGGGGANNPLNTTQPTADSTLLVGNSAGVRNYGSLDTGVQATVKTLLNGYYPNIVAALKAGNAEQADAQGQLAKDLSTWSGGGYTTLVGVKAAPTNSIDSQGKTGGGLSSGSGLGAAGAPISGQDLADYAEKEFPQYAYLLHDAEVGPILVKAAQEGVTDSNILAGMLRDTNWYQKTSSTARGFDEMKADDPATWQQAVDNTLAKIQRKAAQLGVAIPPDQAQQMAVNYRRLSWTDDQLTQQIATYAKYQGDITYKGDAAADVNTLRGIYSDYALPVTDATLNKQLQDVLAGKTTTADIQATVAEQAATLYGSNPALAQFLTSGKGSTSDWAAPYISTAANLLGVNPANINLTDPQWSFILKPQTNAQTGQSTGMAQTLDSVEQKIKTDPVFGYSKTANGIADYQRLVDGLRSVFTGGGVIS